jgi:hypothetical protein
MTTLTINNSLKEINIALAGFAYIEDQDCKFKVFEKCDCNNFFCRFADFGLECGEFREIGGYYHKAEAVEFANSLIKKHKQTQGA